MCVEVTLGRTGANDPSFNLISEPLLLLRREAAAGSMLLASVIEPHGYFSESEERSSEARGRLHSVRVLADGAEGSVVEVTGREGVRWLVMVANGPADAGARHRLTAGGATYEWTGTHAVQGITPGR